MKRTLTLTVSFDTTDASAATRKTRAFFKWCGRVWRMRVITFTWRDE